MTPSRRYSPRRSPLTTVPAALALAATVAVPAQAAIAQPGPATPAPATTGPAQATAPSLRVQVVATGLDIPWDLQFISSTRYLVTERSGRLWLGSTSGGALTPVTAWFGDLLVRGEAGLLGLAVDPAFASNRQFYTCQTRTGGSGPTDVRVVRWRLSADGSRAWRVGAPVLTGIPVGTMHLGCRLLVAQDGTLMVSTGDAATGPAPQKLGNLAGKTLRINRDGTVPADNPYTGWAGPNRYVWTYGHRNPQGLALRPGTAQVFAAEHGPDRDDEVNLLRKGRNYGWGPTVGGSSAYDQSVPMTDRSRYPGAVQAVWSSGTPTIATSGADFASGAQWGSWNGALFVAQLKGAGVMVLTLAADGSVTSRAEVSELDDTYGRIRTVRRAPDGAMYVLTSNGSGTDRILRVTPG